MAYNEAWKVDLEIGPQPTCQSCQTRKAPTLSQADDSSIRTLVGNKKAIVSGLAERATHGRGLCRLLKQAAVGCIPSPELHSVAAASPPPEPSR